MSQRAGCLLPGVRAHGRGLTRGTSRLGLGRLGSLTKIPHKNCRRCQCSHESAREPSLVPRSSAVGGGRGAAAERVHSCRGAPIPRDDSGQRCGAPRLGRFAATLFPLRTSAEPAPRPRSVPFGAELPRGGAVGHLILIAAVSGNNSSQLRLHYVHTDGAAARKHRDAAAREQAAGG